MTDNVAVTPGVGATIATDDVSGVQYQRVKVDLGGDGAASPLVRGQQAKDGSLPVTIASDQGSLSVALQTGDATAGRVKITDGTDVADVLDLANSNPVAVAIVDGAGTQVTSFGGGTQYTEDAAAAANPVGNALIAVRDDARGGSLVSTDGDNVALRGTNAGELYVKHVDAIPVTDNSSTLSVDDGGGSLTVDGSVTASIAAGASTIAKAEDAASADADVGVPAMAVRKATPANTSGTDGDYEMLQVSAGRLWASATITDGSGNVVGATSNALDVNIKSGGGGGTQYTEDAVAAADPIGNAIIVVRDDTRAGSVVSTNGDNIALRGTNSGEVYVKHVDAIPVTDNSGTLSIDDGGGSITVDGTVSITANSAVNVAQINGVTPLMGAGNTGTGSPRVTLATDQAALAGLGAGATGTAVPANAIFAGLSDGTSLRGQLQAANALNSTGTGLATAQVVGQFDDVSPTAISENQFGNLRMSANRNLYGTIRDAAGNERGANVNASSQLSVSIDNNPVLGAAASTIVGQVKLTDGTNVVDVLSVTKKALVVGVVDASGNQITAFGGNGTATTCDVSITRPANTTAYAANDIWSDSTSAPTTGGFTWSNAVSSSGKSGVVTDIVVSSSNDPATLLYCEVWIFDQAVTNTNDNAAFAMSDSDVLNLVGVVPLQLASSQNGSGTNSWAHAQNLNIGFTCVGTANLRILVKVKVAYTPASGEVLKLRAKIIQTN